MQTNLADVSKIDLHLFDEIFWKTCPVRRLQISEMSPMSEILLANFFRTTVYVYRESRAKNVRKPKNYPGFWRKTVTGVVNCFYRRWRENFEGKQIVWQFQKKLFTQLGQAHLAVDLKTKFYACRETCNQKELSKRKKYSGNWAKRSSLISSKLLSEAFKLTFGSKTTVFGQFQKIKVSTDF